MCNANRTQVKYLSEGRRCERNKYFLMWEEDKDFSVFILCLRQQERGQSLPELSVDYFDNFVR